MQKCMEEVEVEEVAEAKGKFGQTFGKFERKEVSRRIHKILTEVNKNVDYTVVCSKWGGKRLADEGGGIHCSFAVR